MKVANSPTMVNLLLGKTTYPSSEESSTGEIGLSVARAGTVVACSYHRDLERDLETDSFQMLPWSGAHA